MTHVWDYVAQKRETGICSYMSLNKRRYRMFLVITGCVACTEIFSWHKI